MTIFHTFSAEVARECGFGVAVLKELQHNHQYQAFFQLQNKLWKNIGSILQLQYHWTSGGIYNDQTKLLDIQQQSLDQAIKEWYSYAVAAYQPSTNQHLSIREDRFSLNKTNLSLLTPLNTYQRITKNQHISKLLHHPFYHHLINFVMNERGLFLKTRDNPSQKNYFNTSLNWWLPVIKKKDEIHEWTFMLHDIFHLLLPDPILQWNENEQEKKVYIVSRMIWEAISLVMADMLSIEHAWLEKSWYDVEKRKIYPLVQQKRNSIDSLTNIKKTAYANAIYCIFWDISKLQDIFWNWDALTDYNNKYKKFFSWDYQWNEHNVKSFFRQWHENKYKPTWYLYANELMQLISADAVETSESRLSFDKLFEYYRKHIESVILYCQDFNEVATTKIALEKYLHWQVLLRHKYSVVLSQEYDLKHFDQQYQLSIDQIKRAWTMEELSQLFNTINQILLSMIDFLVQQKTVLPHHAKTYQQYIPHFEPMYVWYDWQDAEYELLDSISRRILGNDFVSSYYVDPVRRELEDIYFTLINQNE